jgi:hypothetical protein
MNTEELLNYFQHSTANISVLSVTLNLFIGFIISLIIIYHYNNYSLVLSCRKSFKNVLPFITLVTILVITIVKSSLALSLGLVGALSIVRFRTPIKEPEELAYLFLTIGVGLGLGANLTLLTIVSFIVIIILLTIPKTKINKNVTDGFILHIENISADIKIEELNKGLLEVTKKLDLRRLDKTDSTDLVFLVHFDSISNIITLRDLLDTEYPHIHYSIIDQSDLPVA